MSILIKNDIINNKHRSFKKNRSLRINMQINLTIISLCLMLIIISIWISYEKFDSHTIILKQNQPVIHILSDKFLSFGLDSSLLRNMKNLPIDHEKFINLTRYLSPAYIRIGGTNADCLYFNQTEIKVEEKYSKNNIVNGADISNFILTSNDFVSLYEFSQKSEIKMLFDLNTLLRNSDGTWDSSNAKEMIIFAKNYGMQLDWQMGNEPNSFLHVFNVSISAEQLAKDYCTLRTLLNKLGYQECILVGPEVNHIGDEKNRGSKYAKDFLTNVHNCIDYVTWHQYYLNGHIAQVQDFVNSTVFNRLPTQIEIMSKAISSSGKNISMWLSETSSAYGGGAPKLSDRFVAGFLWLDKLGYSAKTGVQVVIRQSLFGSHYAMIDADLNPNPDWWVSVLFKQFVSRKVLSLSNNFGNLRLYAHCTSEQSSMNNTSTVTVYGVNLNKKKIKLYIQGVQKESKISYYILTSDSLQSRNIFMNGKILKLQKNGSLPHFEARITNANQAIILPPYSMIFLLLHSLEIWECLN